MTKNEFFDAAIRHGVAPSAAIDDPEGFDNGITRKQLGDLWEEACRKMSGAPEPEVTRGGVTHRSYCAIFNGGTFCNCGARPSGNRQADPSVIHQVPVTVTDQDGNKQTVPWSLVVVGEPRANAARSRPWFCEAHGEQWGDTCPYCVQAFR